jgi:hypothetical protein
MGRELRHPHTLSEQIDNMESGSMNTKRKRMANSVTWYEKK